MYHVELNDTITVKKCLLLTEIIKFAQNTFLGNKLHVQEEKMDFLDRYVGM